MVRNFALFFMMAAVALTVMIFQNCANPAPYDRGSSSSTGSTPTESGDTTPRLDRTDNDDRTPPDLSQPLPRFVQDSGTSADERARGMVQTSDGHFITTGFARNNPEDNTGMDVLFKKFDAEGVLVYSRRIGDGFENQAYKAIELSDAYVVAGLTRTIVDDDEGRSADLMLVRINKDDGDVIETFRYGTTDTEAIHDIIRTTDNNGEVMVAVGYHFDRITGVKSALAVKFDMGFNIIWSNRFTAGPDSLTLQSVAYVPGGGYYAAGFRDGANNKDSLILRFSYAGALTGSRLLNNSGNEDDLRDIGFDGQDIIAVGRLNGNGFNGEGVIHRFAPNLVHEGTKIVGINGSLQRFMDLNTHPDGSLILAGTSNHRGNQDNWVIKIRNDAQLTPGEDPVVFSHIYGTTGGDTNQFHSLLLRRDYGYAFITSMNNPRASGTMSPSLLLLDQFGEIPGGCSYIIDPNRMFDVTVRDNATFVWDEYNMTSSNVPLDVQSISFSAVSDDPTSSNYCVN